MTLNYATCNKAKSRLVLSDRLPAGMHYVAGSARWSETGSLVLTDAVIGTDRQGSGPMQIAYDFNVTTPGAVTASIYNLPANWSASVTFDVEIDAGLALGTSIPNSASYVYYDAAGVYGGALYTNTASYLVNGRVDLDLVGSRVASATPGATVDFTNVLTNRGDAADTFDITLGASTFPAGTTFALFKGDGVTPLADTDGDGTPDTGALAPGASYTIVVRVRIPESAPPAAYKVTKTARSARSAQRIASADDLLDTVALRCVTVLEPDNQALIGRGQHVTYSHYLTNRGNCVETVRAMLDYLGDSKAASGWTSAAYVDNRVAGGGSVPGVVDPTDTPIVQGWTTQLAPGENLRLLVDVHAPQAKRAGAKAIVDSDVTTFVLTSTTLGALTVHDTTSVDDAGNAAQPANAIRNFTDASYASPSVWGVIGGALYLRADAAACVATPLVVESRPVVITGPNGEREELVALETGPGTGIFVVPALAVRAPPVVALDRILEGRPNDVFQIELLGCDRRIATVVTLMEPVGVVFDSRTNEPVAGASVTLVTSTGSQCSATLAAFGGAGVANPVLTATDGRFVFPQLSGGDYCLVVRPPNGYRFASQVPSNLLPQGRNLHLTGVMRGGSYGNSFAIAPGGFVVIDVPVDRVAQDGLFVQKEASRAIAEVGEFIDYSVRVRNGTGNALASADVLLNDDLPAGFAYVPGSARRDGATIADPAGGRGPRLSFALGRLAREGQVNLTYRVRIGPGALQGDGVNRVQASYSAFGATTLSNIATAKVSVTGGVFTDKGFILGKIFLDCNVNGVQDRGEPGVPGVRLVLEDGTYVITDGGGKFSFYGIVNRTHVVKVDRTTLPTGARLEALSARHLGDGASRIVDLKSGEMQRADFALEGCEPALAKEVEARAQRIAKADELAALAGTQLTTEARVITDVKALPASGVIERTAPNAVPGAPVSAPGSVLPGTSFTAVLPSATPQRPSPGPPAAEVGVTAPKVAAGAEPAAGEALETLVLSLDDQLGFIGLSDGETLPYAQTTLRVKGAAGATFTLRVNGVEVPASRVGKRATALEKKVQAWEYVGVELAPGENTLTVSQHDSFGVERGSATIHVTAPDRLARIAIELPARGAVADGKTPATIVVTLSDRRGVPVTVRTPVTLEASRGRWQAEDLDPAEPGVQVFVEHGRGQFALLPPLEPGESQISVRSGAIKAQARLDFLPELRSLIANGVIEGIVNVRNVNTRALQPARATDGFERELRTLSREWDAGRTQAGARAAFYLKGKIKGEYLLTAAYDSDKDTQERLFRDIQPDEFYPIYGDSALRGFDAQSTSRLYVRIDHRRSYLLWGDFTTTATSDTRKLSNYNRSLTGVKEHFENSRVSANLFASRDSTRQVIEELRANGTSGPYQLGTPGALVNSEKVEIIARDRNQPALVISSVPQTRFADYEIEALTGRILFKAPVASFDANLNPVFVRITYEVDQGGESFWVAGLDVQVKLGNRVEVGGVYVKDKNPLLPFTLVGANTVVKVGEGTYVIGEVARTEHGLEALTGGAARIEVKHESPNLKAQAFVARTERG
ncbi:MAG TPA: SdrD B-like domain-containing protein, partial [Usitatibacter sp.]|nr:SdrD B-like domain-containing protein [Usitatibacter sp.]